MAAFPVLRKGCAPELALPVEVYTWVSAAEAVISCSPLKEPFEGILGADLAP